MATPRSRWNVLRLRPPSPLPLMLLIAAATVIQVRGNKGRRGNAPLIAILICFITAIVSQLQLPLLRLLHPTANIGAAALHNPTLLRTSWLLQLLLPLLLLRKAASKGLLLADRIC